jgi:hypothetical protein
MHDSWFRLTEGDIMFKGLFAALTLVGIVLLAWGMKAYQSLGSELTETFTGAPSDKAIWLLAGGAAATLVGIFGLIRGRRNI